MRVIFYPLPPLTFLAYRSIVKIGQQNTGGNVMHVLSTQTLEALHPNLWKEVKTGHLMESSIEFQEVAEKHKK